MHIQLPLSSLQQGSATGQGRGRPSGTQTNHKRGHHRADHVCHSEIACIAYSLPCHHASRPRGSGLRRAAPPYSRRNRAVIQASIKQASYHSRFFVRRLVDQPPFNVRLELRAHRFLLEAQAQQCSCKGLAHAQRDIGSYSMGSRAGLFCRPRAQTALMFYTSYTEVGQGRIKADGWVCAASSAGGACSGQQWLRCQTCVARCHASSSTFPCGHGACHTGLTGGSDLPEGSDRWRRPRR